MNAPFGRTGVILGSLLYLLWIVGPLVLMLFVALLRRPGTKIDLSVGFLTMLSLAGLGGGLFFAGALFFQARWIAFLPLGLALLAVVGSLLQAPFYILRARRDAAALRERQQAHAAAKETEPAANRATSRPVSPAPEPRPVPRRGPSPGPTVPS